MKRGSVFDTVAIISILIAFAIVSLFGIRILNEFNAGLSQSGLVTGTGAQIIEDQTTRMPVMFDTAFLLILVIGWIALLVSGFMLNTNPAFLIIAVVFNLIILIVAGPMTNVYLEIADHSDLAEYSSQMPATYFIMNNMLIVVLAMIVSTMIATYAGYRQGAGFI